MAFVWKWKFQIEVFSQKEKKKTAEQVTKSVLAPPYVVIIWEC